MNRKEGNFGAEKGKSLLTMAREMFPSFDSLSEAEKSKILSLLKEVDEQSDKIEKVMAMYREVFKSRWRMRSKCWKLEKRVEELEREKYRGQWDKSSETWMFSDN